MQGCSIWYRALYGNLNPLMPGVINAKHKNHIKEDSPSFQIWIVKLIFLTFAMAKDDRRERHRSLLHFP